MDQAADSMAGVGGQEDLSADLARVVPNSLQDIGRASDGAKRRPVKGEGWAGA
jgi:hypothetical protein